MTISSQNRQAGPYLGNDVATAFTFAFKVFAASDLQVVRADAAGVESTLTLTTDYTVTLNSNQDSNPGGTVTLVAGALVSGTKLTITSSIAPLQATDLTNQGGFYPKVITNALDKLTILIQQIVNGLGRSIKLPISNSDDGTLPASDRTNTVIGFDSLGKLKLYVAQVGTSLIDLAASAGSALVGFIQSGAGAVARFVQDVLRERDSVLNYIPTNLHAGIKAGTNTTPLHTYIQAGIDAVKISRKILFFPAGIYLIGGSIANITPNQLFQDDPKNGIHLKGEPGTILKAAATFPSSDAMLNLDGNPTASELVVAYVQTHNIIEKLEFDGSGVADRAIRLRANWLCKFEDLYLHTFAGNGLGVIHIKGVTTPTKDDADTTFGCLFKRVRIRGSASGYGVLGTDNRSSTLAFENCDIRDCYGDGIRLAVAGMTVQGCTIAGCGSAGLTTTGGVSIVKAQTNARNRGVAIHGCELENNYWHEINIDYCFGFTIAGCFGSPYQHSGATAQSWIRMGGDTAQGGVLTGNSTMDYSNLYGYDINIYEFKAGASNISIINPVIQRSTADDYVVDAAATNITKNGVLISADKKPAFSAYMTNGSANQSITTSTFTKINIDTEEYDQGSCFDTTNKRFTPTRAGYYQINAGMEFTPSGTASRGMLVLYKNGAQYRRFGDVYASGGQIGGSTLVYLNGSTDFVELYGFITATTPLVGYGSSATYMNGAFVGDA